MGRFKVRLGEAEIEYEGEDSGMRYDAAIQWVESVSGGESSERLPKNKGRVNELKESKRGGQRSAVIGPALDALIDGGWMNQHRNVASIMEELKSKGTPGVTNRNVNVACMRRVRAGKLDTILDQGQRVFWTKKTTRN